MRCSTAAADTRRAPTAAERLAACVAAQHRRRRRALERQVAGARGARLVRVIPAFFERSGELHVHALAATADAVVAALAGEAIFALDSAMRLTYGFGMLRGGDVWAYLGDAAALRRLARDGLVLAAPHPDRHLVRPWPGPPRLLACVTAEPPAFRVVAGGVRVVDAARLRRELVGACGPRPDLFARLEAGEAALAGR